jgi:hypothetical protein
MEVDASMLGPLYMDEKGCRGHEKSTEIHLTKIGVVVRIRDPEVNFYCSICWEWRGTCIKYFSLIDNPLPP